MQKFGLLVPYIRNFKKIILIMKLCSLLLLISLATASAKTSYSQQTKFTLNLENATVKQLFDKIEGSSEFIFVYYDNIIDLNKEVTVNANNETVEEILEKVFKTSDITYKVFDRQIVIAKKENSKIDSETSSIPQPQKKEISGSVHDYKGAPLPGVSVVVKGTTTGTITNNEGKFTLSIPNEAETIVFSFIGMKSQEIFMTGRTSFNIVMKEEAVQLSEVVAVGYGITTTREKLTGSIATVQPKLLADRGATTTPLGLITGLATNVRVTASSSMPGVDPVVQIREVSSWKTGEGVLYVIDGVIRDLVAFEALNPNDIASMSILKDAASSAIYGMKAGQGVILVTTKMGETGKVKINYGFSYSSSSPIILAKKLSAYAYAKNLNMYAKLLGLAPNASQWFLPYELEYFKTHNYNSLDEFWSNPRSKNHNLSASGGTEKSKYFLSGSWNTTDQPTFGVNYEKYTILAKLENKFTNRLTLNFSISASWDKNTRPGGDIAGNDMSFGGLLMKSSTTPYYKVIDGVKYPLDGSVAKVMFQDAGYSAFNKASINPRASLKYSIPGVKGLNANAQFAYNNSFGKDKYWSVSPYYYNIIYDRHIPTDQFNYAHSRGWKTRDVQGNNTYASLTQSYNSADGYQGNYQLTYANTFGRHNVSALAGYEFRGSKGDYIQAYRRGFALESYNQISGGSSDVNNQQTAGDITSQNGMASWIGRLDYDFDGKYILGATIRRDGSYKFAPDHRWGTFPAVSAAWIVSKESFFEPVKSVISSFKIRGSYGLTGTDTTNPWQWLDTFAGGSQISFGSDIFPTLSTSVVPNPFITWEKNSNYNLGADFGMFDNHLTFSLEGWYTRTTDILSNRLVSTPTIIGANLPDVNYGIMSAQGTEFTINYSNKTGELNFSVGGNIAYNVNKVLVKDQAANLRPYESEIGQPTYRLRGWNIQVNETGNGVIRTQIEAERIMAENAVGASRYLTAGTQIQPGMLFAQDHFGSSNGLFRDSPDGNANHNGNDDKVWFDGKYNSPRMNFGINTSLSYKGFDLNMIAAGVGYYSRNQNGGLVGIGAFQNLWFNEWTPWNINEAGPSPMYGGLYGPNNLNFPGGGVTMGSTINLFNMTFLRMKNISLGYNIPAQISRKVGIQGVKVYMNMENPFMIFKMCPKQYDPESAEGSAYPILRNYALGVNITL
jgi:TonB-linked SusC/RagA family outer membrane protein